MSGVVDLTVARWRRADPGIPREVALERTLELYDIIACARAYWSARPSPYPEFKLEQLNESLLRTTFDVWGDDGSDESVWLMSMLTDAGGDDLYERYLRLANHLNPGACDVPLLWDEARLAAFHAALVAEGFEIEDKRDER